METCNNLYQVNEIRLLVRLFLLPLMLKFSGGHLVPAEVDVIQLRLLGNRNCNTHRHRYNVEMIIKSDLFVSSKTVIEIINH